MAKIVNDYDELKPKLAERCCICQQIFAKKHPKDNRTICNKCAEKLRELIEKETDV